MKKILIAILFTCLLNVANAEYNADEIVLDIEPIQSAAQNYNRNFASKSCNYTTTTNKQITPLFNNNSQSTPKSAKYKKEKQYKKMTIGTEYNSTFTEESASQNRSLYSKYKVNDRFSVKTNYDTKTTEQINDQIKGSFSIAPEMRINSKMSVSNVLSRNLGSKSSSEEVKLNIEPFKDGRMDLNVGVGETQYDDGSPSHSRINIGTQFKF